MRLAIWNYPAAEFLVSGFSSGAVDAPFDIERHPPEECAARFVEGEVDVALLPTSMALQAYDDIDAIPTVGLVAWKYPFARLAWSGGLHDFPQTIAHNQRHAQEKFVARVILHEHYQQDPEFIAYDGTTPPTDLLNADEDAALLVGPDVPSMQVAGFTMDLGREWYELTNYPMVWGLFVTRRGEADNELIEAFIDNAKAAEEHRDVWVQAQEPPAALEPFYREDLRIRIDRLGIASLTELRTYLFYYDVMGEIPDVPFASIEEDEEEKESEAQS